MTGFNRRGDRIDELITLLELCERVPHFDEQGMKRGECPICWATTGHVEWHQDLKDLALVHGFDCPLAKLLGAKRGAEPEVEVANPRNYE